LETQTASNIAETLPPLLVLIGSTAVGKTEVALELGERIGAEIINADSMQIYRGMDIGTAKPTPEERARVPFHLLDVADPDTPFSVADWKSLAESKMEEISKRGKRVLICGGTGLYIRALLEGWTLAETPQNPETRHALRTELEARGAPALHERLREVDPETAERLHPNDGVRIVRALEVYQTTGRTIAALQAENRATCQERNALRFGLEMPRTELYARINARVDKMMEEGFLEEVRALHTKGYDRSLTSMKSLGYKELLAHIDGGTDLPTTVEAVKCKTRQFAKRQQTWFRADQKIAWFASSGMSSTEVAEQIAETISQSQRL
jgi:tRNA dimethylallyltransferase